MNTNNDKNRIFGAIYINYENKYMRAGRYIGINTHYVATKILSGISKDYKNSKYVSMKFPFVFGMYEIIRGNNVKKVFWYEANIKIVPVTERLKKNIYVVNIAQKPDVELENFLKNINYTTNKEIWINADQNEYSQSNEDEIEFMEYH